MEKMHNILVFPCVMAVLSCANVFGQPYTFSKVSGNAYQGAFSQANSHNANGSTSGDFSSGFNVWRSGAQADSTFGFNSISAETSYAYEVGYGSPAYGDDPAASASYSLDWSIAGSSQCGTIVSAELGLGGSLAGQYAGSFSFVYGTTYDIESLLTVDTSNTYANSQAKSVWDDTFTFSGQPNGTIGTAIFTVSLDGSISEEDSQYSISNLLGVFNYNEVTLNANFDNGADLSSIDLPANTIINDASGNIYETPEPSTVTFIGMGLGGLILYRRKRKFLSVVQSRY